MWPFKSSAQMASDFIATRHPLDNEEFIRECKLPAGAKSSAIALGVRKVIAELGQVEPIYIRASDKFDDELLSLPFWDSLDAYAIVLALEEHFDISISNDEALQILNPEFSRGMTVADFVRDAFNALANKIAG